MERPAKDLAPKNTAHDYFIMLDRSSALRAYPSGALHRGSRAGGQGSQPHGSDHRQPERQGCSKRGSGLDPQGYDAGKKVTGRKRHILVDTLGLLLNVIVLPADILDRHAAIDLLRKRRPRFTLVERIYADGGYAGAKTAAAVRSTGCLKIEIVSAGSLSGRLRGSVAIDD